MLGILKEYGISRVFVLGVGFSAPIGMPLTKDLLREANAVAETKPWHGEEGKLYPNG